MNGPPSATLSDLASLELLVGRRVRLLEDVGSFVQAGSVGVVLAVRSVEPRATVRYWRHPWGAYLGYQEIESPFAKLELVGDDESA